MNGEKCPVCGWDVDAECRCEGKTSDFTDSNKLATPERIAELKELGEAWMNTSYLRVVEGIKHALDAPSGGPICGDTECSNIRYDPREVECEKCRELVLESWRWIDE